MKRRNPPMAPVQRRLWLASWLHNRRWKRAQTKKLILSSDGHGHLTWVSNVIVNIGFLIFHSVDGIAWNNYDAQDANKLYRDCSGDPGYFRISAGDEEGTPILPYSNAVYSDGL